MARLLEPPAALRPPEPPAVPPPAVPPPAVPPPAVPSPPPPPLLLLLLPLTRLLLLLLLMRSRLRWLPPMLLPPRAPRWPRAAPLPALAPAQAQVAREGSTRAAL
mgnify:CR=1 FL=1